MSEQEFLKTIIDTYCKYYDIDKIYLTKIKNLGFEFSFIDSVGCRYDCNLNLPKSFDPEIIKQIFIEAGKYN